MSLQTFLPDRSLGDKAVWAHALCSFPWQLRGCHTVDAQDASLHWELRASGSTQRQNSWRETPHRGAQGNIRVISLYPIKVFLSFVVGTPFHLYKKEKKLFNWACRFCICSSDRSVHWCYNYSSRQESDSFAETYAPGL